MPLYYNMMYMYDHIMPYLSPKLQIDIQNAVFSNTPLEYFSKAFSLTQRLKLNARGMVSNMVSIDSCLLCSSCSVIIKHLRLMNTICHFVLQIELTPGSIVNPIPLVY